MSDELENQDLKETSVNRDKLLGNDEELQKTIDKLRNGNDNTVKEFLKLDTKEKAKITSAYALLSQIAIQMIVIMGMMFFLGRWLDKVLGTSPVFLLLCLLLGMASAFKSIYDIGMNQVKKFEKHDRVYNSYRKYKDDDLVKKNDDDDDSDF